MISYSPFAKAKMKLSVALLLACVVVVVSAATETGPDGLKRDRRFLGAGN